MSGQKMLSGCSHSFFSISHIGNRPVDRLNNVSVGRFVEQDIGYWLRGDMAYLLGFAASASALWPPSTGPHEEGR